MSPTSGREGNNPATNNGGSGSGEPWTATGACSSCSSAPAVPTGLAASGTTQSSTNLSWTAVTPPAGCTVSYKVLQSSTVIASPTTTSDAVTGLNPSTTYSFSVEATDSAGTSAASSAVNVTTSASSCTTKPSAPTGFAASGTTDSSTNLSLERGQSSERMHYQLLDYGRAFDPHNQLDLRYRRWTIAFNQLHLLADSDRLCRFIASNDSDCVDIRSQHSLYGWMV